MDALTLLVRLAAKEVERVRQGLAVLDARLDEQRRVLAGEQAAIERERGAAGDIAGARALATWLAARRQRMQLARHELARLEEERAAQLARLIERRLEVKRMELLQERQRERRRAEERAREQKVIDEVAVMRAARRGIE